MSDAADREQSVQNDFFNEARKTRARVAIVLTSGKRITGRIKAFDRFAVVIDAGGSDEMVFKHILPAAGLMMCMSTFYYAYLAYKLAKKTGRTDITLEELNALGIHY